MGCRAHLCHLSGLGHIGHSPKGNQWECWDPGQGPNVVGPLSSCHQLSEQPAAWQVDILSHGWLADQLQLTIWLAGWLPIEQNVNLTPLGRDILWPSVSLHCWHRLVVKCTPSRDISWPSLVLLWAGWPLVRCPPRQRHVVAKRVTTLLRLTSGHMYPHPKCRFWVMLTFSQASGHADLWSDVPSPRRHLVAKCDTTSGHCSEKPHFVCFVETTK